MKNSRYYPFERNRYFYGKLLTVRDFESEQKYFNDKRRLINRLLFGSGVVCGLKVIAVDDKTISVEAGVAIDCLGREIVVASPVTQKLSMIEGFTNNEYTKNVYLCIEYDEKGKEPVHSVGTSSARSEEISEYNRLQEGYRLVVREEAPDPAVFGYSRLVEDNRLIYSDKEIRIWQKTPRYVNPGEIFEITIKMEKALQTPRTEFEYQITAEQFYPADGSETLKISFSEPDFGQETEYEYRYPLRAGSDYGKTGKISVKGGRVRLKIGDKQIDAETNCENNVQIINGSIQETVLQSYFDLSMDQCVDCPSEQYIYLARISLLHLGPTFIIEKLEKVPFGEYVYNASVLYKLGINQPVVSPSRPQSWDVTGGAALAAAEVTGIQGMGVNTPMAAAVADATIGFAMELHIPKGNILTIGTLSIILANGIDVMAIFFGSTIKEDGATPKLHFNIAPPQTKLPMIKPFLSCFLSFSVGPPPDPYF